MHKSNTLTRLEFKTAKTFETWLEKNHDNSSGIWLKIFKKDAGIKTVTYAEALDVALCYGWIDGQKKSFDEQAWLQKFSPRTAKSIWSKVNVGHVERLIKEGKMRPAGLKAVESAKEDGRWEKAYDPPSKMTIPDDFLQELSKNKKAEEFFQGLNRRIFSLSGFDCKPQKSKRRDRRIEEIIEKLARGEKLQ
ncbi:MAG: YdeI/OmpD-associated family protein [Saprospiraceae bacterium]